MPLACGTFPTTTTLSQGLSSYWVCRDGCSLHPCDARGTQRPVPSTSAPKQYQITTGWGLAWGIEMIPISVLLALSRSLAELSRTEGLHGAVPAHPSMGRSRADTQP